MAVVGIDDTDSRSAGMCTTWIGATLAERLPEAARPTTYLIRLHPAIPHKTRGNGAVAVAADVDATGLLELARELIDEHAVLDDAETNPGAAAVSDADATARSRVDFARAAVRGPVSRSDARKEIETGVHEEWANGRGIIGAVAAIGAVGATRTAAHEPVFDDWTYEYLAYRERPRWGSDREVTLEGGTDAGWDTVDRATDELVCVPRSPCPVLYGLRGDEPSGLREIGGRLGGEPVANARLFRTNQGTDAHLRPGRVGSLEHGAGYRVRGRVASSPTTKEGGHVRFGLEANGNRCDCLAFAPTGRFRDHVRALRGGDVVIACGESDGGAIKLEKFALVGRALTRQEVPTCPTCGRSMKSAGRDQGYRCRGCAEHTPGKRRAPADRALEIGWYEVPPEARRHLSKPLARGGYELPVHPSGA